MCQSAANSVPANSSVYHTFFNTYDYLSMSRYAVKDSSLSALVCDFVSDEGNSARMVMKLF